VAARCAGSAGGNAGDRLPEHQVIEYGHKFPVSFREGLIEGAFAEGEMSPMRRVNSIGCLRSLADLVRRQVAVRERWPPRRQLPLFRLSSPQGGDPVREGLGGSLDHRLRLRAHRGL
jgi:hypothetical protein